MAIAWGSDRRLFDLTATPDRRPEGPNRRVRKRPSLAETRPQAARLYPAGGCVSITTEPEFLELEPLWRELYQQTADVSPFRSWDFVVEWYRHFVLGRRGGATGKFEVALAFDRHGRPIGAVPLFEERSLGSAMLGLALQPFGRSHSLETMTDEPVVLLRRGHEAAATRALTEHVAGRMTAGGWDLATIPGGPQEARPGKRSCSWSRRLDSVELARPIGSAMTLPLPRAWEAFVAGLSKSMRDNIPYYPRRLSREIGRWTIQTARTAAEVAIAIEQLIDLHGRRSRSAIGVNHRNHIPGPAEASFLRRWFARAAARGEVTIVTIEVGGEIVAAQAFLEGADAISVYYSGYDDRYYRYSPLTIITAHVIQSAIERGVRKLEFPPGPTPWKSRWGAVAGPAHDEVSVYDIRLPALLRGLSRRLRLRLSGWRLAPI